MDARIPETETWLHLTLAHPVSLVPSVSASRNPGRTRCCLSSPTHVEPTAGSWADGRGDHSGRLLRFFSGIFFRRLLPFQDRTCVQLTPRLPLVWTVALTWADRRDNPIRRRRPDGSAARLPGHVRRLQPSCQEQRGQTRVPCTCEPSTHRSLNVLAVRCEGASGTPTRRPVLVAMQVYGRCRTQGPHAVMRQARRPQVGQACDGSMNGASWSGKCGLAVQPCYRAQPASRQTRSPSFWVYFLLHLPSLGLPCRGSSSNPHHFFPRLSMPHTELVLIRFLTGIPAACEASRARD